MEGRLFIGTSGWSYPSWKGVFYPRGLPPRDWLGHYAGRFNSVEVNSTFYRLPRESAVRRWAEASPGGFRLCLKLWQEVTHRRRLRDARGAVRQAMAALAPARAAAGPLLAQLPPGLAADAALLDDFLSLMAEEAPGWPLAVEMRHPSWHTGTVADTLDRHKAALVLHDMPRAPSDQPNGGSPFLYLRYHGPEGDYGGSYGEERLCGDARRIRAWLAGGRDVYAFFNNDRDGFAVRNAEALRRLASPRAGGGPLLRGAGFEGFPLAEDASVW